MQRAQRLFFAGLWPMAVFLPAWATISHTGWLTLVTMFILSPIIFVALIILNSLIRTRPGMKQARQVSVPDVWLLAALYLSILLFGFFIVDGGDTAESINSASMAIFGRGFEDTAERLSQIFSVISVLVYIAALFVVTIERFEKRN